MPLESGGCSWRLRGDSEPGELCDHPLGDAPPGEALPGLTLAAQVLFTVVFGPLGLLMALPLAVVMQVLIAEVLIKDVLNRWSTVRLRT